MRLPLLLAIALTACRGAGTPTAVVLEPAPATTVPVLLPNGPADPPPPALRLGDDVRPTHHDLRLTIDPEAPTYTGEVHIDVTLARATRFFWMHAQDLTIIDAAVGPDADHTSPARVVTADGGLLGLGLGSELPAGPAHLVIHFTGQLDEQRSRGAYRVKEPDGHFYVYTFFEPVDARRAFPCFDEPGFKAPWALTITAAPGSIAVANAPQRSEQAGAGGEHTYVFDETPPLPSYLVAFVVGPYEIVDGGKAGHHDTPLRFIIPQGRAGELLYALEVTPRAVGLLEDWFGIPYPFAKLDVAVVPRFWGTMEHPGLVALGQPLTLIKPEEETLQRTQRYANIMIHELGHYWFGDLVTMAWWNETWLNEGMTEWVDRQVTAQVDPSWKFEREAWSRASEAMSGDAQASAKALRQRVESPTDIQSAFDGALTYFKGDAVLGMFERWVGADVFRTGLRRYLNDHAHGNATSEDLLGALDAESGRDLSTAMKTFIDQPGVPEVGVQLVCEAGKAPRVALSQKRYRPLGQDLDDATPRWHIPVCLRWGVGKTTATRCELLTNRAAELTLDAGRCPDWIHGNADAAGYYHVRYDAAGQKALLAHRKQLAPSERYALLRDVAAAVAAGGLDVGVALAAATPFLADPDAPVAQIAFGILGFIDRDRLTEAQLPRYRRMIKKLAAPLAKRLGWRPRQDEPVDDHALRGDALGLMIYGAEVSAYAARAGTLARAWLADRGAVDPDLVGLVLHGAAHVGDAALFDAYLLQAGTTTDREDRGRLYGALGSFRDHALLTRALTLTIDPATDMRDVRGVLFAAFGARETREQAWTFLQAHFDELAARMRDDEKAGLLYAPAAFCDAAHRQDAERFLSGRAATIDGGAAALARSLGFIDVCIAQRERFAPGIAVFLDTY